LNIDIFLCLMHVYEFFNNILFLDVWILFGVWINNGFESILNHMLGSCVFKDFGYLCPLLTDWLNTSKKLNIFVDRPWGMLFAGVEMVEPSLSTLFWGFVIFCVGEFEELPGDEIPFIWDLIFPKTIKFKFTW
jgi:hypothetical protein